jgi:TDG/mug DNA glycosylase family protein
MQIESHVLPDVLPTGLCAVICGTAVGTTSAVVKAYYADHRNRFWSVLQEVGLTTRKVAPGEFATLPEFGLGLTDLAKEVAGTDPTLRSDAFDVLAFKKLIRGCRPAIVAFNGMRAARAFYGISPRALLAYGPGPPIPDFPQIFVLPSTSGSARGYWKLEPWQEFARLVEVKRGEMVGNLGCSKAPSALHSN